MSLYQALARRRPVDLPVNAILKFEQVDNTQFIENPLTGNPEPVTTVVDINASLRRIKPSTLTDSREMLSEQLYLRGYLHPTGDELHGLDISQQCRLELTEPSVDGKVEGIFVFQVRVSPYGKQIREVVGVPVEGVLTLAGSGEVG